MFVHRFAEDSVRPESFAFGAVAKAMIGSFDIVFGEVDR
jgi:NADH:ubiquinone oxidoreductase subunit D